MKKIFWTSIVRIALFGIFLLYMKWFNQPLASWVSNFIVKWEKSIEIESTIEQENNRTIEQENDGTIEQEDATIEQENDKNTEQANNDILSHWTKLFEQLDRIESSIIKSDTIEASIQTWETQEEMFDEFKIRYEKNKK